MKLRICLLALLLCVVSVAAQSTENSAYLNATTCPATSAAATGCVNLSVAGLSHAGIQVDGTYSGTVSFEGTINGLTWVALNATPANSATAASSTTGTGAWQASVGGLSIIRARMSSYMSGTAFVILKAAP